MTNPVDVVTLKLRETRFTDTAMSTEEKVELYRQMIREGNFPVEDQWNDGIEITVEPDDLDAIRAELDAA